MNHRTYGAAYDAVADAARRLAAAGLVVGTAGNVSRRVHGTDHVAVTASGVVLGECTPADVCLVDAEGALVAGGLPTSELDLHLGLYADDPAAAAVVHTHAPFSTAVACVLDELPVLHYQQLLLGGAVRVAPYATCGTPELAGHVRAALDGRRGALMANHGAVTVGATLDEAVEHALLLEWLAGLHQRASALGMPRLLTHDQQAAAVEARRRIASVGGHVLDTQVIGIESVPEGAQGRHRPGTAARTATSPSTRSWP